MTDSECFFFLTGASKNYLELEFLEYIDTN